MLQGVQSIFSPANVVPSRTLNRMGMQIFRMLSANAAYRSRTAVTSILAPHDETAHQAAELRNNGYLLLPNFLSESDFAVVRAEYDAAIEKHKDLSTRIDTAGIVGVKVRKIDWKAETPAINKLILHSERIDRIVARAQGWPQAAFAKKIRRNFQLFRSYMSEEPNKYIKDDLDGSSTNFHSDTYFRLFKAFFFISDVTQGTAATRVCKGTNKLSVSRLKFEYENSIGRDRGSSFVPLTRYSEIMDEVVHIEGPRNSLALLDTFTIHGRGLFDSRSAVRDLVEVHYFSKPYTL